MKLKETLTLDCGFDVIFESNEVLQLSGPGQLDILYANRDL